MSNNRWIGNLHGSRFGNAYWEEDAVGDGHLIFTQSDGTTLRFVTGIASGANRAVALHFRDKDTQALSCAGALTFEDSSTSHRIGKWELVDGSAGTFEFVKKTFSVGTSIANPLEGSQISVANRTRPLGAVTIYRSDLESLLAEIESYFDQPVIPIIRAKEDEQFLVFNAREYLARPEIPDIVK